MSALARRRLLRPITLLAAVACAAVVMSPAGAQAATSKNSTTVTTKSGLGVTVTPVRQLSPSGATIKVTGTGFNPLVGIYVALCVTPAKGQKPTPCGGGANAAGTSAASAWISSNPPYGKDLAIPYRKGGRFSVTIQVSSTIVDGVDCRTVSCSIVTRADHLHLAERAYDVIVPVTFRP